MKLRSRLEPPEIDGLASELCLIWFEDNESAVDGKQKGGIQEGHFHVNGFCYSSKKYLIGQWKTSTHYAGVKQPYIKGWLKFDDIVEVLKD